MKKKIIRAVLLVIFLALIGTGVFLFKKYYDTENGRTKLYAKEIKDSLNLQGNKTVIKIIKDDYNKDGTEDYIALLGEEMYDETDTTKAEGFKKLNANLEMYNNITIDFVNGLSKEVIRYDTKKSYGADVNLGIKTNEQRSYIMVDDRTTGSIALLYLKEDNTFTNVIVDSFGNEFNGYTINAEFNKEDPTKLKVNLDNYGRSYLQERKDEYILDYSDKETINSENYRLTYLANKYCVFSLINNPESNDFVLECIQHILYCNKTEMQKNAGIVKTTFDFEGNKLVFKDVVVEK